MLIRPTAIALALTGIAFAASAYMMRDRARRALAEQHALAIARWEGEGGIVLPDEKLSGNTG
jgi:hypothetical protein